jgi:hypothetical protein
VDALRAVFTVFGARPCLDRQQRTHLDRVGDLIVTVHALRVKKEVHKRQGEQSLYLRKRPVVTNGAERSWIHGVSRGQARKISEMGYLESRREGSSRAASLVSTAVATVG